MSPTGNENYTRRNMTLSEAMEYAKYLRKHLLTGDDLNYTWKKNKKVINSSWQ